MRGQTIDGRAIGYGGEGTKPEPAKPKPAEAPKDGAKPEPGPGEKG